MARKKDYSKLSKEALIQLIEKLERKKKYGLVWDAERVPEQVVLNCKHDLPVLTEVKEKEIFTSDDEPTHILIEGDNYHALSVLNYTHQGKIDLIYIDPPFNSGKKDWKYNNHYVDKNDTWRHSKWIQFMHNRLVVARNLLTERGTLICAIDHNEQENLGVLLREVFPSREITCITIVHNPAGIQGLNFSHTNEYAYFVYPRGGEFIEKTSREKDLVSPLRDWGGTSARRLAKTCFYPILVRDGEIVDFGDVCADEVHPEASNQVLADGTILVFPIDQHGIERKWVYNRSSAMKNRHELFCVFQDDLYVIKRRKELFRHRTVWKDKKYYANIYGTKLLNGIIDAKFPFPKSLFTVKDCISAVKHDKSNATILDFFAGSGTTGHAILALNKEDGGNRRAILCTNNESNIAEEVTYPRMRNIMYGYTGKATEIKTLFEKDLTVEDVKNASELMSNINQLKADSKDSFTDFELQVDGGVLTYTGQRKSAGKIDGYGENLRYFRTAFVENSANKDQVRIDITHRCTEMLCLREGIFRKLKEETDWKIFEKKDRFMGVYYNFVSGTLQGLRDEMNALKGDKVLYCFSVDPQGLVTEDYADWNDVRLEPIPQKILDIYKQLFEDE